MVMRKDIDRESALTMIVVAALFVFGIVFFASKGAFAKPPAPGGPKPPTPEPPPPAQPAEPVVKIDLAAPPPDAPAWLLEGGAPPSGRELLGWYSYRGVWIRIEGEPGPGTKGTGWVWWYVIAGDATPLALAKAWQETATLHADANIDAAAAKAAVWVDENLGGAPPVA